MSDWDQFARANDWDEFARVGENPRPAMSIARAGVQDDLDALAGMVRGAGSIGATLLRPFDGKEGSKRRRQAMTDALREMGADTDSTRFALGKIGTEIAGTAGAPGAVAKVVAPFAPWLAPAIESAGMSKGALTGLKGYAARVLGGTAAGAGAAGLVDPEQAPTGGMIGGMLPAALLPLVYGAKAAGRTIGPLVSDKAAKSSAVHRIASDVGDDAQRLIYELRAPRNRPAGVGQSAAGATMSPELGRLEQASRLSDPGAWAAFDQTQADDVWQAVRRATSEADDLGARFTTRQDNWKRGIKEAVAHVDSAAFAARIKGLKAAVKVARKTPESVNPDIRAAINEVDEAIKRYGSNFGPEHLQQLRANFNGKMNPVAASAMKRAPRDAVPVRKIMDEMDDILESTTGGRWSPVRARYADDSKGVYAAKAASKVRSVFADPISGLPRVPAADLAGDVPRVTEARLRAAMHGAKLPGAATTDLSADAQQAIADILEAQRRAGVVQKFKRAGSAGGGSDTASNIMAMAARGAAGKTIPGGGGLLSVLHDAATGKTTRATSGLLMDPDLLAAELARLLAPGQQNGLLPLGSTSAAVLLSDR